MIYHELFRRTLLRPDPRCQTFASVGVGTWVGIAGIAASAGMAAAQSNAAAHAQPNLAASSAQLSDAQTQMLPIQRQLEAAAQQGGKTTIQNYPAHQEQIAVYNVKPGDYGISNKSPRPGVFGAIGYAQNRDKTVQVPVSEWQPGGSMYGKPIPADNTRSMMSYQAPAGPKTFDFTGYGAADVASKLADAQAKLGLDLAGKYDSQFIAENLKQQALADPQAVAARQRMSELTQQQINDVPSRPVADMLDAQVGDTLAASARHGLTNTDQTRLDSAVAEAQSARGGTAGNNDFSRPLTTGFQGEARDASARQQAMGWLSSGATPEDTAYRREQQNLANLSAEVNGKTPQSQFRSLSGAQQGPTPMTNGQPLSVLPNGQDQFANQNAIANWNTNRSAINSQANPYSTALATIINGMGAVKSMGA